jgi:holin-like protein
VSGIVRSLLGFGVLVGFLALGGLAHDALGLPVPGSVLGMLGLWAALEAGVVRLSWVRDAGGLLLAVLGLLFVPAGAGWAGVEASASTILGALAVLVLATVVALGVAGRVAQLGVDDGA